MAISLDDLVQWILPVDDRLEISRFDEPSEVPDRGGTTAGNHEPQFPAVQQRCDDRQDRDVPEEPDIR